MRLYGGTSSGGSSLGHAVGAATVDVGCGAIAYLKKAGLKPASDTEKPPQRLKFNGRSVLQLAEPK